MRLTKKRADNGRYYLSGLAEVLNSYPKGYGLIQVGHAVDKLAEYEDLEEQNRLLKLPCAVGDTVYSFSFYRVYVMHVESFITYEDHIDVRLVSDTPENPFLKCDIDIKELGKRWFLTKEEAEAALKEFERGKGE